MSKFRNGDRVIVRRLGEATPGEWKAVIRGVYAEHSLSSSYIVEWTNGSPREDDPWDCAVFVEGCIDPDTTSGRAA